MPCMFLRVHVKDESRNTAALKIMTVFTCAFQVSADFISFHLILLGTASIQLNTIPKENKLQLKVYNICF